MASAQALDVSRALNFAQARRTMVDCQVRPNGVTDPRIIAAMDDIPREHFVPDERKSLAYLDKDLEVGGRTSSRLMIQAMTFAKLAQAAEIGPHDHVLDVGCGTGYGAAVLARLAKSVIALECDPLLAGQAENLLRPIAPEIQVVLAPLESGALRHAPFDAILVEGAVEAMPAELGAQLKEGGRLVCIVQHQSMGQAMVYTKTGSDLTGRVVFNAAAPLLSGFSVPHRFQL